MPCEFCLADPQPAHFANPRHCLFRDDGTFDPDNWNCGFQSRLLEHRFSQEIEGLDCSVQAFANPDDTQMLVFFRYKHRGRASTLVILRDEPGIEGFELATRKTAEPYFAVLRKDRRRAN